MDQKRRTLLNIVEHHSGLGIRSGGGKQTRYPAGGDNFAGDGGSRIDGGRFGGTQSRGDTIRPLPEPYRPGYIAHSRPLAARRRFPHVLPPPRCICGVRSVTPGENAPRQVCRPGKFRRAAVFDPGARSRAVNLQCPISLIYAPAGSLASSTIRALYIDDELIQPGNTDALRGGRRHSVAHGQTDNYNQN